MKRGEGQGNETDADAVAPPSRSASAILGLWGPPLLWALFIYLLSTDVGSTQNTQGILFRILALLWPGVLDLSASAQYAIQFTLRKAAHLTVYAVLAALLLRAMVRGGASPDRGAKVAFVLALLYAAFDEAHQSFVGSRTASLMDVGIDGAGAALGIALYRVWVRRRKVALRSGEGRGRRGRGA